MAGEIVSGFGSDGVESWEDYVSEMPVVLLETEFFQAEAIPLHAMPGLKVLDAMVSPEGLKMIKMFDLFKLAINSPGKLKDLEVLTFSELNSIMAQWIRKSAASEGIGDPFEGFAENDSGDNQ